jgi:hypothetical protein
MIYKKREGLLFIEPSSPASEEPLIDAVTRKMVAAYRASSRPEYVSCGFHWCTCGTASKAYDSILPSGLITNSLCVHYLAHHRDDVPSGELEKVAGLDVGEAGPTYDELWGMSPVLREDPVERRRREVKAPPQKPAGRKAWWIFWR